MKIKTLSEIIKYNYFKYNCTDFVLDVFNTVRPLDQILEISKPYIKIGRRRFTIKCNTPLGLFKELVIMKPNEAEAKNIII